MKSEEREIGIKVEKPKQKCNDINCPFHGSLKIRKKMFKGTIISSKMHRTAVVEWDWRNYLQKYERYEKKRTRIKVHNPECLNAVEGDVVRIIECRPLSKTKHFVIVEKMGKEKGFLEKIQAREEAKIEKVSKEENVSINNGQGEE